MCSKNCSFVLCLDQTMTRVSDTLARMHLRDSGISSKVSWTGSHSGTYQMGDFLHLSHAHTLGVWVPWKQFSQKMFLKGLFQYSYLVIWPCRNFVEGWSQKRHATHKSWQWRDHLAQMWCNYLLLWTDNGSMGDDLMLNAKLVEDQLNDNGPKKDLATTDGWWAGALWTDDPKKLLDGLSIDNDLSLKSSQNKKTRK